VKQVFVPEGRKINRLIGDRAYDSEALRSRLAAMEIDLICPHRRNRKRPKLQDGRKLRRYRKRWKIERFFAWLGTSRRLVVRWDRDPEIYRAFFHVACIMILVRRL
jgi:transposase